MCRKMFIFLLHYTKKKFVAARNLEFSTLIIQMVKFGNSDCENISKLCFKLLARWLGLDLWNNKKVALIV